MSNENIHLSWSGRRDSNSRPSAPKADALPGCATPRTLLIYTLVINKSKHLFKFKLNKFNIYFIIGQLSLSPTFPLSSPAFNSKTNLTFSLLEMLDLSIAIAFL